MSDKRANAGLALLALVASIVVFSALHQPTREPVAQVTRPAPPPSASAIHKAVFLGDSYTAGAAAGPGRGYVDLVATAMQWSATNLGQGSTGYASHGDANHDGTNYVDRLPKVIAAHPDIVIVFGGRNDEGLPAASVQAAVRATLDGIHRGLPHARILVCGPNWSNEPVPADVPRIRDQVKAEAAAIGADYLEMLTPNIWTGKTSTMFSDGANIHPNDAGHAYIASLIIAKLNSMHV